MIILLLAWPFGGELIIVTSATTIEQSSEYQQCIANPASCTTLYLSYNYNSLTGTVPTELGELTRMTTLIARRAVQPSGERRCYVCMIMLLRYEAFPRVSPPREVHPVAECMLRDQHMESRPTRQSALTGGPESGRRDNRATGPPHPCRRVRAAWAQPRTAVRCSA
ncbi:hypothetical protein CYMTET_27044 [Cymbomonas tetramitiformis]|uniref:Uncharacterized protein n=1 Tax=Cymbomonas tetramitiformis TaxID=36881 RepID=A0AAE0KX97_9CHLO|nr:hypothetical protein CYMTET_27044 [Cymbomonas tetramitiformis]